MISQREMPNGLLAELLENQYLTMQEDKVHFSDEYLLGVIKCKQRFSRAEQQQLLRSPLSRERLAILTQMVRAQVYKQWTERSVQLETLQAMAASDANEIIKRHDYKREQYHLSLIPLDTVGKVWEIRVTVFEWVRQEATDLGIKMVDDGGQIWISGKPDEYGELHAYWSLSESPVRRLHQYPLRLKLC